MHSPLRHVSEKVLSPKGKLGFRFRFGNQVLIVNDTSQKKKKKKSMKQQNPKGQEITLKNNLAGKESYKTQRRECQGGQRRAKSVRHHGNVRQSIQGRRK